MIHYRGFLVNSGYGFAAHMDLLALATVGARFRCCSLAPEKIAADTFGRASRVARRHHAADCWRAKGPHLVRAIPTDVLGPFPRARSAPGAAAYADAAQRVACLTVFEAPVWPAGWVGASNCYDRISVPTPWLADAARAAGVRTPVRVIPHTMDWPDPMPAPRLPRHECWFESDAVADGPLVLVDGTYMARKNIAGAVEAFYRFGAGRLFIHTHFFQPGHRDRLAGEILAVRKKLRQRSYPPVLVSDASLDWRGLWAMYAAADIYLSMARAEGVGMGLLMAAGLRKPVVCADIIGHRATVPAASFVRAAPIPASKALADDPMTRWDAFRIAHVYPTDPWGEPDPEEAARLLLRALPYPAAAAIRRKHDPAAVGRQLVALAEEMMVGERKR